MTPGLLDLSEIGVRQQGQRQAELDKFSLAMNERETVVMLGEAGCGADAVLRVVGRFADPGDQVSGTCRYRGVDMDASTRARRIAFLPSPVPQPLSPHASVIAQLTRVVARKLAIPKAGARAELRAALGRLRGAPSFEDLERKPLQLDPAAIAWALLAGVVAQAPDLILADDPAGSLAPAEAHALLRALLAEKERLGCGLLYSARSLNAAIWLGGRVIVMRKGRIVEEGTAERLSTMQAHAYTQTLFKAAPRLSTEKPARNIARGETLLRVTGLELSDRKSSHARAHEGITFELRRGAALALIGEEGSGRRALARTVLGLDRIVKGRVVLNAVDLSILSETMTSRLRRRVAFVTGADDALDPRMTIVDTVDEPLRAHLRMAHEMIVGHREAALKRVGLASHDGQRTVASLTRFDKRRLQVARAIVSAPLLAVIDEPLTGLDAFAQVILRDLLTDFRAQEGPAFLVITADFSVAQTLADEAMVFKDRRVIARGPIHELLRDPKDPIVRALIDASSPARAASLPQAASGV